jgi:hypothetical protein
MSLSVTRNTIYYTNYFLKSIVLQTGITLIILQNILLMIIIR